MKDPFFGHNSRREAKLTSLLCGTLFSVAYFSLEAAFAQEENKLSIEIIALRDVSGNVYLPHGEAFEIRFSNLSDQRIVLWDEECQFGHGALSFNITEPGGRNFVAWKCPVPADVWTKYPPKTVTIPPKRDHSRKVTFSAIWLNAPEPNSGEKAEVRAVFEVKPTTETKVLGVWSGRVESSVLVAPILNPKLKTPHDYLWSSCPKQALKMLKEDPSWIGKVDERHEGTPLHHAARFAHREVVVWLLENGANVNALAYSAFTPLHLTEQRDIAQILVKAGANLDQKDAWGKTPLQKAIEQRKQEVIDVILESGGKLNLYTALLLNRRDLALKMLINDPDVIVGGEGGSDLFGNTTPLGWAAMQGDFELLNMLLTAEAPINDATECPNFGGYTTPLCNAVWAGKVEIVEFLLKKGAATDVTGGKFYSSITEYAEKKSDKRIVELLKQYKNNPRLKPEEFLEDDMPKIKNKLPARIASGDFKLPNRNSDK